MNSDEAVTLEEIIKDFENNNADIKINLQPVPFDQAQNKFKIVAQAGEGPDIFRSEIAWTSEEAALGYLLELDSYISDEDKKDYLKAPFAYNVYKGHIYGIPQTTDCLALIYNKRLFKEAGVKVPETIDEFRDVGMKLSIDSNGKNATDPGFNPDKIKQYGFYFNGKEYFFQPFMWAFGGDLLDPEKQEILINSPGSIEAINYLIDLRDKYNVTPKNFDLANSYDNMMAGFKEGKYAMITNGPWATSEILTGSEFKNNPDNLGVAVIPKGPGGYGSPVGGHNLVVTRSASFPNEAYRFISYINKVEFQAKFTIKNNLLPTRQSAYKLPEVASNKLIIQFKKQLDVSRNRPVIPQGGLLYNDLKPYFQAAYLKEMKPQDAMDETARCWKKLMSW
jgi:arabinogalactan oligomer/maltooligosaccharide transport system substrate-binding protein